MRKSAKLTIAGVGVAALAGVDQAWDTWAERFALPLDHADIGYGHDDAEVDAVRVDDLTLLVDYHRAVHDLSRAYAERVDAACARALALGTRSYTSVAAILKNRREQPTATDEPAALLHENIRGPGYYH